LRTPGPRNSSLVRQRSGWIQPSRPRSTLAAEYRVFLTPSGDTRGLFVAMRTVNGFIVRESQGGHATVSFDYRIVATALGQAGERMALTRAAAAIARVARPVIPKMQAALARLPPKLALPLKAR
jgi:hypothetical protein